MQTLRGSNGRGWTRDSTLLAEFPDPDHESGPDGKDAVSVRLLAAALSLRLPHREEPPQRPPLEASTRAVLIRTVDNKCQIVTRVWVAGLHGVDEACSGPSPPHCASKAGRVQLFLRARVERIGTIAS
jgi:hypothetical protein